jgi:flagellar biosynthesis/type III secretory pathway protein FliH
MVTLVRLAAALLLVTACAGCTQTLQGRAQPAAKSVVGSAACPSDDVDRCIREAVAKARDDAVNEYKQQHQWDSEAAYQRGYDDGLNQGRRAAEDRTADDSGPP